MFAPSLETLQSIKALVQSICNFIVVVFRRGIQLQPSRSKFSRLQNAIMFRLFVLGLDFLANTRQCFGFVWVNFEFLLNDMGQNSEMGNCMSSSRRRHIGLNSFFSDWLHFDHLHFETDMENWFDGASYFSHFLFHKKNLFLFRFDEELRLEFIETVIVYFLERTHHQEIDEVWKTDKSHTFRT